MSADLTCEQVALLLSEHGEGALAASEAAAVDKHLEGCAGCRAERADVSAMVAALREAARVEGEAEPGDLFFARFGQTVRQQYLEAEAARLRGLARQRGKVWRWSLATGSLLAAAAVLALVLWPQGPSPQAPRPAIGEVAGGARAGAVVELPAEPSVDDLSPDQLLGLMSTFDAETADRAEAIGDSGLAALVEDLAAPPDAPALALVEQLDETALRRLATALGWAADEGERKSGPG